jgi:hypothetical protein
VTSSEEVELVRDYWTRHFGLTSLVAFDTVQLLSSSDEGARGRRDTHTPKFLADYGLGRGAPIIMILDRQGKARARMMGFKEDKIRLIVERLLAEPIS